METRIGPLKFCDRRIETGRQIIDLLLLRARQVSHQPIECRNLHLDGYNVIYREHVTPTQASIRGTNYTRGGQFHWHGPSPCVSPSSIC